MRNASVRSAEASSSACLTAATSASPSPAFNRAASTASTPASSPLEVAGFSLRSALTVHASASSANFNNSGTEAMADSAPVKPEADAPPINRAIKDFKA